MNILKTFRKAAGLMVTASLCAAMFAGCGSGGASNGNSDAESGKETVSTIGAENGEEMEMWTFVELHAKFYEEMLNQWNEQNPDKQIKINFTVLPYDDMHNKLQSALLSGKGAPDMCDIELGKFANFLKGEPQLESFNDAINPYKDKIVKSRLDLYSKDGKVYGLPTHVGATVAFYNTELLEAAGIDYATIKTWDDFKAAGEKYYAATGKYLGTADTSATWQINAMLAQQSTDYVDESGKPQLNSSEMIKGITKLKELQDANAIATVPGGQPDTEEAYGAYNNGDYACAIMPFWQMSRYTNYMPELSGKIAIAPVPVLEEGMPSSVGGGGTGTVVTKTAKNVQLAKEFLAFAKLSEDGNVKIWQKLGFDPCNTDIWTNEAITHDENNEFVKYFKNNPFDVLNEIKDEIKLIKSVDASPTINNTLCTVTLNSIFEDGQDITEALTEAQEQVENELQ
ncbi:MAG: carbohydrate ABC transporter substrate-binding protein [Clostridium butyricum]|nr:carbohydrate ABC transporter substrate-binding protein [Clostridium butyricum]